MSEFNPFKAAFTTVMALSVILIAFAWATPVSTGHIGVVTSFGKFVTALEPGMHWYNPFQYDVYEMDTRVQRMDIETATYTNDLQQADIKAVINYRLDPVSAAEVYVTVGRDWQERLVPQAVTAAMKDEIGKQTAEKLIANRDLARNGIESRVREALGSKHVLLNSVEITNIDYSEAYERSVEEKAVAVQRALAEVNRTRQVEERAKQTVASAEAEAESIRIRAQALERNDKLIELERIAMQKEVGLAMAAKGLPPNLTIFGGDSIPAFMLGMTPGK